MLDAFLNEEVGIPSASILSSAAKAPGSASIYEEKEDDEYGDIEWCEEPDAEQAETEESTTSKSKPEAASEPLDEANICGSSAKAAEPSLAAAASFIGAALKKKTQNEEVHRRTRRHAPELRRQAALQHRVLALCFATRLRSLSSACDDQVVQAMLLSLGGGRSIAASSGSPNLNSNSSWRQLEQQLDRLLARTGGKPSRQELRATLPISSCCRLLRILLGHQAASQEDRASLLVASCRSVGIPARIVMLLPLPGASACGKLLEGCMLPLPSVWAEVFDESSNQWLPVFGHSSADASAVVEPARLARAPWLLAVGEGGQLYDATRRYCQRWTTVLGARGSLARGWDMIITGLGDGSSTNDLSYCISGSRSAAAALRADIMDERALAKKALLEPLPASRAGFKRHRSYVLESQFSQNEIVYPASAKPVGLFQGKEKIWRRSDVTELRTTAQWQRHGRRPRKEERAQKLLRGGSMFASSLYGIWQTELLPVAKPTHMDDGHHRLIPGLNSFGNYELLDASAADRLPAGLIHVAHDLAQKVAIDLRITFAPAVSGFTRDRAGQAKPRYNGVVIWDTDQDIVQQAILKEAERCEILAEEKRNQRLASAWQMLVKSVLVDRYVEDRYRST